MKRVWLKGIFCFSLFLNLAVVGTFGVVLGRKTFQLLHACSRTVDLKKAISVS